MLLYVKLKAQVLGEHATTDHVVIKVGLAYSDRSAADNDRLQLIRLAIVTACPTTVVAIVGAVLSTVRSSARSPGGAYNIVFVSALPATYTLVVIATLLTRGRLRAELHGSGLASSAPRPNLTFTGPTSVPHGAPCAPVFPISVVVEQNVVEDFELRCPQDAQRPRFGTAGRTAGESDLGKRDESSFRTT